MKEEVWKTTHISSYHEVSNFGRVRTIERTIRKILHHSRIISQSLNREGYPKVFLNTPNGEVTITVHRLVAKAFIPNPNNLPQVNHKDENKTNNNVDNLEWCDATYNLNYGNRSKIASEHRKFKGGNNKINIFVLNENKTIIANTISEAEHITGVTRMKIRTSINDINKSGRYSSKLNSYVSFTIQTI
jgi:hypothetical protein